jgi:very-short-patch-repair endonuclease
MKTRYNYHANKLTARARELRKNQTPAELKLWNVLRKAKAKVYRQRVVHGFIADFYIPKYNIVIELDGEYHNDQEQIFLDKEREDILKVTDFKLSDLLTNKS